MSLRHNNALAMIMLPSIKSNIVIIIIILLQASFKIDTSVPQFKWKAISFYSDKINKHGTVTATSYWRDNRANGRPQFISGELRTTDQPGKLIFHNGEHNMPCK